MTENAPRADRDDRNDAAVKDPEDWVTGDEPATASQRSYVETLAQDAGAEVPEEMSKAEASKLIDDLQDRSPRLG